MDEVINRYKFLFLVLNATDTAAKTANVIIVTATRNCLQLKGLTNETRFTTGYLQIKTASSTLWIIKAIVNSRVARRGSERVFNLFKLGLVFSINKGNNPFKVRNFQLMNFHATVQYPAFIKSAPNPQSFLTSFYAYQSARKNFSDRYR